MVEDGSNALKTRLTRDRIIRAAVQRLAERGFAGTFLATIAEAMGMSRQPIYYHFENRVELMAAVARHIPSLHASDYASRFKALCETGLTPWE